MQQNPHAAILILRIIIVVRLVWQGDEVSRLNVAFTESLGSFTNYVPSTTVETANPYLGLAAFPPKKDYPFTLLMPKFPTILNVDPILVIAVSHLPSPFPRGFWCINPFGYITTTDRSTSPRSILWNASSTSPSPMVSDTKPSRSRRPCR